MNIHLHDFMSKITISNRQLEIINASGKILTNKGLNGLTIKNLAQEMGFSESAIYRHFKSKQEIILAMLNYLAENLEDIYIKSYSKEQSAIHNLKQLVTNKFLFFKENPYFAVAVFSDGLFNNTEEVNNAIHRIMDIKIKHFKPLINEIQLNGMFDSELSVDEILHLIMGSFRLQMFKWKTANFDFDISNAIAQRLNSVIYLLNRTDKI